MIYLLLILLLIITFVLGILFSPIAIFLRARNDDAWDDSNMLNIFRLVAHIATHPSDFGKMKFDDGTYPFWYINKDEFSEVVKSRPKE